MAWHGVQRLLRVEEHTSKKHWECWHQAVPQNVHQTDTQHSLAYYSLIRNIFFFFCLTWAWQSPASHSLYMALALSELIKRHFLTSPDAQREKKKSRERRKAPEGGTLLSLFTVWVNEDFSQCPLPFFSHSFSFLTFGKNCKHIYIYISAVVFFLVVFFLATSPAIILR